MLYIYMDKIYVMPFEYKMIEVVVSKKGNEYNVTATEKTIDVTSDIKKELYSITVEEAYNIQHRKNKLSSLD